ncbi:CLUMA_CG000274, isoform A [Clunio marinus]|uniref:CLUMA_CG000274, isoform A n=1 Tax=Clunio marinus TaxID=568069 RepID=A0A1J1HEF8_9DIPT|nr:CLUMA_CG000274, isoform A [Clunio marinus]
MFSSVLKRAATTRTKRFIINILLKHVREKFVRFFVFFFFENISFGSCKFVFPRLPDFSSDELCFCEEAAVEAAYESIQTVYRDISTDGENSDHFSFYYLKEKAPDSRKASMHTHKKKLLK